MAVRNWLGNNGLWSDPTQWDTGIPVADDAANFPSGTYTAQFATIADLSTLAGGTSAGLDVQSGLLTIQGISGFDGSWLGLIAQSGGTLQIENGQFVSSGTFTQTGGTVSIAAGARLAIEGTATIGGQLSGTGALAIGGAVTLMGGSLAIATLQMGSTGTLTLGGDTSLGGGVSAASGTLALGGHDLTISGQSAIGGVQASGPGTLTIAGTALVGGLNLGGAGGVLADTGVLVSDSNLGLPSGPTATANGAINIGTSGVLDLVTDNLVTGTTADAIVNAGLLEKTAGVAGSRSSIQVPLINTGTVRSAVGTFLLDGQNTTLDGTLDGGGTILIGGTATVGASAALNVWQLGVGFGGLLELSGSTAPVSNIEANQASTIALQGNTLITQGAGTLGGTILGQGGTAASPGSLFVNGVYDVGGLVVTGGTSWLEDRGTMVANGAVVLGNDAADHVPFQIDAGATYENTADDSVASIETFNSGTTLDGAILNNGTFVNTAGGNGTFLIQTPFANNVGGTLINQTGTMRFGQSVINDGTGTLAGSVSFAGGLQASTGHIGTLEIAPNATVTIAGAVNSSETLDFQNGPGGMLIVSTPSLFNGHIDHLGAGQTIDLRAHANTYVESAGIYTFFEEFGGTTMQVAQFSMDFPDSFALTDDSNGGTDIVGTPPGQIFPGLFNTAVADGWGGGSVADWDLASGWDLKTTPNSGNDVEILTATTTEFGQDPSGMSTGTVNSLMGFGDLDISSGNLIVNGGGTWIGGNLNVTGGAFDSVTGYGFQGKALALGAAGRLVSDNGTLTLSFTTFSDSGAMSGDGEIVGNATVNVEPGAVINVATLAIPGEVVFNGNATLSDRFQLSGQVSLTGSTLTLTDLAALSGTMIDPGTVAIAQGASVDLSGFLFGTADLVSVAGFAFQTTGDVNGTTNAAITISAGATYDLEGDQSIFLAAGKGPLVNTGLFEKAGGDGTSTLEGNVVSTGTFSVRTGTVAMSLGNLDASGTITGAGALSIASSGSINSLTLEPATFINVASLVIGNTQLNGDQSDLNSVTSTGNLTLQGHTFALGGAAELSGFIVGNGEVDLSHTADLNNLSVSGTGTVIRVSGTVTQSGAIALGQGTADAVTLAVTASGVFDDLVDTTLFGTSNGSPIGTIVNAGLFEKTGGSGNTTITTAVTNTGTIADAQATLTLSGPVLNDSVVSAAGNLVVNGSIGADAGQIGTIVLGPAATLVANGMIAASQTIVYDPGGLIQIAQPGNFAATIDGFMAGDRIELLNDTSVTGVGQSGSAILLYGTSGVVGTIAASNLATPAPLVVSNDGSDTFITSEAGRTLSWLGSANAAFDAAASWNDLPDGLDPAQAAPATNDTVQFNNPSGAITGSGMVADVQVGSNATGVLQMSSGSTVITSVLDAGIVASAVGQIGLTGAGTDLAVNGDATVADDGTGVLSVLSGATFSAGTLTIGSLADSSGAVVVSGAGSAIDVAGALNVGTSLGTGDLTVGPGAAVDASVVNLEGQAVLEGGLLDPTVQLINQGQTAGGFGTIAAGDIVDEGAIQAGGNKASQKLLIVQGTVLGGGTLTVNGTLPGSVPAGIMQINAGGTLELSGAVLNAATTTFTDNLTPQGTYTVNNSVIDVNFVDSTGVLLLDDIAAFGGTITTFQAGDSFVVTGGTLSAPGVNNGNTLTVADSGPNAGAGGSDKIIFGSAVNAAGFRIINNNTIQAQAPCFAEGTRIETRDGPVPVESLRAGDRIATHRGVHDEIVWIGRRAVNCRAHPRPELVWPVRVQAGAFGETMPLRDLYLSPDHAVFVNGVLIPIRHLVNGRTILQVPREAVTYFHIELAQHDVLLAEGLPVESYLDTGDRSNFENGGVMSRLHPDFSVRMWEAMGCAPLIVAGPVLAAVRARLALASVPRARDTAAWNRSVKVARTMRSIA